MCRCCRTLTSFYDATVVDQKYVKKRTRRIHFARATAPVSQAADSARSYRPVHLINCGFTLERVNTVTPALFNRADNPYDMSLVPVEDIQAIIRPCGLSPQKSKAISRLSHLLIDLHKGEVPADMAALEALPGVGHKTASVVMSQAFGVPAFAVDTHIHRLAQRWGLSNGKSVVQTERDLKRLFPKESWNDLHLQIIYYGREYCSARGCEKNPKSVSSRLLL